MTDQKCAYVALLGQPNAGKSTLFNALVGHKLAGVSRKRQTTRNRVLGVMTESNAQILFLDTPGLHRSRMQGTLDQLMNKEAMGAATDADILCYLVDPFVGMNAMDEQLLGILLGQTKGPLIVVATKVDRFHKKKVEVALQRLGAELEQCMQRLGHDPERIQTMAISAKRPEEVSGLRDRLLTLAPSGEWMFDADALTDRPDKFVCSELIREQLFRRLSDELPYGTAVVVEKMEDQGNIVHIDARVVVAKASHKGMVLGKKGQAIKAIGAGARQMLERHLGKQVFLALHVKVEDSWNEDARMIAELASLTDS